MTTTIVDFTDEDQARLRRLHHDMVRSRLDADEAESMQKTGSLWRIANLHHKERNPQPEGAQQPAEVTTFRTPAGRRITTMTRPSNHREEDTPWREIAHAEGRADPKALRVAHWLHQAVQPAATILFGSRARGSHRPDSDVDIAVIAPPDDVTPDGTTIVALRLTNIIYGQTKDPHVLIITAEEFRKQEQYINTWVTQALLHGFTISEAPEQWDSRYRGDTTARTEYDWEPYQFYSARARQGMHLVATAQKGVVQGPHNTMSAATANAARMAQLGSEEHRSLVANFIHHAMLDALHSVITACGGFVFPEGHYLKALVIETHAAAAATAGEDAMPPLLTDPAEFDRATERPTADHQDFAARAIQDITKVRKAATAIYRRNRRQYG